MNWAERSTAPGVMLATAFDTDAEVLPYRYANAGSPAQFAELIKRVTRHSDAVAGPCLRIAIVGDDTANQGYTQGQAWRRRFRDKDAWPNDGDGVGNLPFWIQFGLKIPAERLIPAAVAGAGGSWKFAIVANMSTSNPMGMGGQSSNNLSHVLTTKNRPAIPTGKSFWPVQYWHNNTYSNGQPNEGAIPGAPGDINLSPGWDQGPKPDYHDQYCSYQDPRGCPLWPTNVWVWFQYRIRIGTYGGTAGNEMDLWWSPAGATNWKLLQTARDYQAGSEAPWPGGFNAIWLTPFETDRVAAGGVNTWMLYRHLIVSLQEIAFPTEETGSGPGPGPDPGPEPVPPPTQAEKDAVLAKLDHASADLAAARAAIVAWPVDGGGGTIPLPSSHAVVEGSATARDIQAATGGAVIPPPTDGWTEIITPTGINALAQPGANGTMIPYMNFADALVITGQDHPGPVPIYYKCVEYDEAGNRFVELPAQPFGVSHGYQHNAIDGAGNRYLLKYGSAYGIWKKVGDVYQAWKTPPYNMSQGVSGALLWWPNLGGVKGSLVFYSGEYGAIYLLNLTTEVWTTLGGMFPGQLGYYHNVSAMVDGKPMVMVYGGGNPYTASNDKVSKQIYRMNGDLTKTRLIDSPQRFGIHNGMNLAGLGNFAYCLGFGEFWRLDPTGAGTWAKLGPPPAGLPMPNEGKPVVVTRGANCLYYIAKVANSGTMFRMWRFTP